MGEWDPDLCVLPSHIKTCIAVWGTQHIFESVSWATSQQRNIHANQALYILLFNHQSKFAAGPDTDRGLVLHCIMPQVPDIILRFTVAAECETFV